MGSAPFGEAQTASTGAIRGTVVDAATATIPNVIVSATSDATGTQRSAVTDTTGTYTLSLLPPGTYKVKFSATGFKTEIPGPVTVTVTEISTVNVTMEIGAQQQTVEVTAAAVPLVQSESATLGTVVEGKTIQTVPLTERNYTQVLTMSTGVAGDVNNAASLGKGTQDVYVNGTGNISNSFHMDGADINNFGSGRAGDFVQQGGIAIPNPDTIAEFKIQTTLYDAGYGRDAGANVDVVTKSGTNQFHGNLFEFFRNEDLDANDPFLKSQGQPRPEMKQNQFGGTFGGPVIKNKLFFFGSYQGTRQINGISPSSFASNSLPALTNDRSSATIGREFCGQATQYGGTQVACDGSNVNPVALAILNQKLANGTYLVPTPQQIHTQSNGQLIGFSSYSIPANFNEDQYVANGDYIMSEKHRLEARYFHSSDPQYQAFSSCSAGCTPGSGVRTTFTNDVASLKLTSALSPTFVNELLGSFIRSTGVLVSDSTISDASLGLTPGNPDYAIIPDITVNGLFSIGGGGNDNSFSVVNTYQALDQISLTRGRHSVRAGFEFERNQFDFNDPNQLRGAMTFQTFPDFLLGQSAGQNGSPYSNVFASTSAQGNYYKAYRASDMDMFLQDDFKVNSRLTLNLGIRWELNGGVGEAFGNMSSAYPNLILSNPATPAGTFGGFVVPANYKASLPAGVTRLSNNTLTSNPLPLHNVGPRFGFAWMPFSNTDKFVLRGGYGIFYTRPNGNSILQTLAGQPFVSRISLSGTSNGAATFQVPFTSPLTPGVWMPRTSTSQLSETFVAPNIDSPLTAQYNLDVQQQILPDTVLEVGYVGTHSSRLAELRNINEPLLASAANPVNGITTNTTANARLRVPYVGFAATGLTAIESYGFSDYNSLQASLKHQMRHGIQFQVAYTWSKVMSTVQGTNGINGVYAGGSGNSNDPDNIHQEWGPAAFDRSQRVVLVYTWNIPGLQAGPAFAQKTLRDWTFTGVGTVQTGTPLTITDSRGGSIYGFASTSRAQICPGANYNQILTSGSVNSRTSDYFNATAFCAEPTIGNGTGYGNTGVGIVRGPGQDNFDMALARRFGLPGIREGSALELRGEFFNAFNHVQFSNPGTAVGTASFGVIGSTSVAARIVQFALKYNF